MRRALACLLLALVTAVPAGADPAVTGLAVRAPMSMDGYTRAQFGPAWTDDNDDALGHNGCDTRDDILARDLTGVLRHGCTVISGVLHDPYTGKTIHFQRGRATSWHVQIDHIVALGDAWRTGAQLLTERQRVDLANDPRNLLAVDGPANAAKGDRDAAHWLPPNSHFRCAYVTDQIAVKNAYHLWVTADEKAAMSTVLSQCRS